MELKMTAKEREEFMEFCRLAGEWYTNNQNAEVHPWGGVGGSADQGRFLYQYEPLTGKCRANGVWGQALAIMALLPLAKRLDWRGDHFRDAAYAAAKYLLTLQILDQRDERTFGALRESNPQSTFIYPRDGATGCMGLCCLYRETKEEEYLYRARLFGDWYIRNAMDKTGWPAYTYHLDKKEGEWREPGVWQAGAGLAFYYLYRLTGEKRYIEEGLRPIMAGYKRICAQSEGLDSLGQDDFAAITALGACLLYDDEQLLGYARRRSRIILGEQDADGSCPGLAGEYVSGLTWHNFYQFARERNLDEDLAPYEKAIAKVAGFAPKIQARDPRDVRAHGGLYGQTSFGVSRALIHQRSVGYALILMLRTEGGTEVPGYNIFGW